MIARGSCAAKILFDMGNYNEAGQQCERAMVISRKLGARRFEPINQMILSKVALLDGDREKAISIAQQAVDSSRETGLPFAGPMALGTLALVTLDPDARQAALDEGLEILKSECVSHNYLWFYRDAMETALQNKQWSLLDRLTLAAETYTQYEPLPWMTLIVKRARVLAAYSKNPDAVQTVKQLASLKDEIFNLGLNSLLSAFDTPR